MQAISESAVEHTVYYMPHHSVLKPGSLTTKMRVVFNASAVTTSGKSLNDILLDGLVVQNDLFTILLRFRKHEIVFIGDIAKMYRQIWVHPTQVDLQRIVWRFKPDNKVQSYALQTLTYGTRPAAFIATRCLKQIALNVQNSEPVESEIILKDIYMDDILTGASDVASLAEIRKKLSAVLQDYGFEIRKFKSNDARVLAGLANTDESKYVINDDNSVKTLGITWIPSSDVFQYNSRIFEKSLASITKRSILSIIAQFFDPLGLLGPVLIRAKLLMQLLWQLGVAWDEPLSDDLCQQWRCFIAEIVQVEVVEIPRKVLIVEPIEIEMHEFCDASEKAYGCVIYIRSV